MSRHTGIGRILAALAGLALVAGLIIVPRVVGQAQEDALLDEVERTMESLHHPTQDSLQVYVDAYGLDTDLLTDKGIDLVELASHAFARLSWNIEDVSVSGEVASVHLSVTNANLKDAVDATIAQQGISMSSYLGLLFGQDGDRSFYQDFLEELYRQVEAADSVSCEVTLRLNKLDGSWQVEDYSLSELASAVLGGLSL